jgi:hypothetical protein
MKGPNLFMGSARMSFQHHKLFILHENILHMVIPFIYGGMGHIRKSPNIGSIQVKILLLANFMVELAFKARLDMGRSK